jgi:hypothetical protein
MGSIIKMYGLISGGTQEALAAIDVPMPGNLVGVNWAVMGQLATDFVLSTQLSFRSSSSFTTNDDRGVISEVRLAYEITTTGSGQLGENVHVPLPNIAVMGGERLYLHVISTASVVGITVALLQFDFDFDKISTRRR